MGSDGADVMCNAREFQVRTAATWNAPLYVCHSKSATVSLPPLVRQFRFTSTIPLNHIVYINQWLPGFTCFRLQRLTTHRHVTLTLTQWPWYMYLTWLFWRRTCVPEMNFLGQGFKKLGYCKKNQTDRQTDIETEVSKNITIPACGW